MIVDELVAILGYDVQGEGELRKFNAGLDNAQRKASAFAASLIRIGAVAATAAAAGMAALGKSVISTSAQFESYAATLETIEGSSEKAEKALDWISEFAKKTPFEVAELTEAFVRLRAYGMDPTSGLMESLGDASSAMGKSLMASVEMIADASTGEFERLKEFGIRASQEGDKVTFSWTENGKALTKVVKKNGAEITKFIQEQFGSRFSGAMVRQSKTWNGMMSNLGDTWVDFQRRIGEGGFFEAVKGQLGRLLDYIGRLDADGTIDRWSRNLSTAFTAAVEGTIFILSRLQRHFQFFSDWASQHPDLFKAIATGLGLIAAVKFPFLTGLFILEDVLTWFQGGDSVISAFAASLSELTGVDAEQLETILATLAGATALAAAAASIGLLTSSLHPLTRALIALGAAFSGAKAALDYLGVKKGELDKEISGMAAVPNPANQPGYIEGGHGYDEKGEFIYMDGPSRRIDRPPERPQAGFTQDALDYKTMLENLEGNRIRMGSAGAASAVVNDNRQDTRNQSTTVNVGGVTVQGVPDATAAVGAAVGRAVGGSAAGAARVSRFEKDDAF